MEGRELHFLLDLLRLLHAAYCIHAVTLPQQASALALLALGLCFALAPPPQMELRRNEVQ